MTMIYLVPDIFEDITYTFAGMSGCIAVNWTHLQRRQNAQSFLGRNHDILARCWSSSKV